MSFATDIEAVAGSPVLSVVIGVFGWGGCGEGEDGTIPLSRREKVLPWAEARVLLDYDYYAGYGSPQCHAITAWTKTHVLFVVQYDGSTRIHRVPRRPSKHVPEMPGG